MPSKQNIQKISEWQMQNVDRIEIKPNKSLKINERINIALTKGYKGKRQTYIIDAILEKLEKDGITLDMVQDAGQPEKP